MVFYLILFYFVMYVYLLEAYYFLTETEKEWIWSGGVVGKNGKSEGMGDYMQEKGRN